MSSIRYYQPDYSIPTEPTIQHIQKGKLTPEDTATSVDILGYPDTHQTLLAHNATEFLFAITNTRDELQGIYAHSFPNDQETRTYYPLEKTATLPTKLQELVNTTYEQQLLNNLSSTPLWRWSKSSTVAHNSTEDPTSDTVRVFVRLDTPERKTSIEDQEGFHTFCTTAERFYDYACTLAKLQQHGMSLTPFLQEVAKEATYHSTPEQFHTYVQYNPDAFIDTLRLYAQQMHQIHTPERITQTEEPILPTFENAEAEMHNWEEAFAKVTNSIITTAQK